MCFLHQPNLGYIDYDLCASPTQPLSDEDNIRQNENAILRIISNPLEKTVIIITLSMTEGYCPSSLSFQLGRATWAQ